MMKLYLIRHDGSFYLGCCESPEDYELDVEMWEIGLANPEIPRAVLANFEDVRPILLANIKTLKKK